MAYSNPYDDPPMSYPKPDPTDNGWEPAQEDYECTTCGYPIGRGESVYWLGDYDSPHCTRRCARNYEPIEHGDGPCLYCGARPAWTNEHGITDCGKCANTSPKGYDPCEEGGKRRAHHSEWTH
jgi:hypothetical protein